MWDIKFPKVLMLLSGFNFPLCKRRSLFVQNPIFGCTYYVLCVYQKDTVNKLRKKASK